MAVPVMERSQNDITSQTNPQDNSQMPAADPREGHRFIDDEDGALEWSEHGSDDDGSVSEELDEADFDDPRAEDEDWEMAERDFTKQYNRLRQHVAVRTGTAEGLQTSVIQTLAPATNANARVAPLPAVNRPRNVDVTKQRDKTADQLEALSKYSSRIAKIEAPWTMGAGVNRKGPSAQANMKDKADRATNEQVLDPRTRIILFKMIGRGLVQEVNGCVSTGKEANVYHASTPTGEHLALKIYKTSILVFKDRDRYVTGEHRFRRGYSRHNPRKMVRLWAEKEMRNLKRLQTAGIRCPSAVEVRENVLVMGFIGDEQGWASPRLKDAEIAEEVYPGLYAELVLAVRTLFQRCKLVHADLSEYNVLFHDGHLVIIDVSQSVEQDHPHAFDFLRADIKNMEDFFERAGVKVLGVRRCFEYVTRSRLTDVGDEEDESAILATWLQEAPEPADSDPMMHTSDERDTSDRARHEDAVFMRSYIPRTLNELVDPERDVNALQSGVGGKPIYASNIALIDKSDPTPNKQLGVRFEDPQGSDKENGSDGKAPVSSDTEEDEEGEEGSEEDGAQPHTERKPRGHRHEDREAKKERKKAVKEEAREKRKHKMPKADKKRKIKATSRGS